MNERVSHLRAEAGEAVREVIGEVKPRLRGWLHLGVAPLILAAGIVLVVLSPNAVTRIGSALFASTGLVLFTVSAIYHRGRWSPPVWRFLRRFDHANIFLLIAGSYTPFALLFLEGTPRVAMLAVAWSGAVLGVAFRLAWTSAPRWLYTPIYIAMGWAAVFFVDDFIAGADRFATGIAIAALVLAIVGGLLYTCGGLVYAFKRPDPWPRWFGFHEVFHTLTIVAFITHYVGVSLATYSLR